MKSMTTALPFGRREFLASSAAFATFGALPFRGLAASLGAPRLTLGIVSDIHLSSLSDPKWGGVDERDFRNALLRFRAAGVDGVVIPGDLASEGLRSDLELVARIWYEVFPNDKLPDGRRVEKLFVTGNHDWDGYKYAKDQIAKIYPDEKVRRANCLVTDFNRHWQACFREPFAPVWMKEVKGYRFVGVNWVMHRHTPEGDIVNDRYEAFLAAHGKELKGERPFFFIQHPHPKDTCYGPKAWGHDNGLSTKLLSRFPNAVALSGHSHYSITDDRSVWQGAFTSIGCGSLACTEPPNPIDDRGEENGSTPKGDAKKKLMPSVTCYRNVQGMVMRVYDDRLVIERHHFEEPAKIGADWVIPLPAGSKPGGLRLGEEAPQFAASARVAIESGDCCDRGGIPHRIFSAVFPQAMIGPRALRYDVAVVTEKGEEVARKTVFEDGFMRGRDPLRANRCAFAYEELPKSGAWRFAVYPRNTWGRSGEPILQLDDAEAELRQHRGSGLW